jgi:cellulase (glycosyl hydrolase family 5)
VAFLLALVPLVGIDSYRQAYPSSTANANAYGILSASLGPKSTGTATVNPTPLCYGWGGILAEAANNAHSSNPPSQVFPGQTASDTEFAFQEMKSRGYNCARVSIVDPGNTPTSGTYNKAAWLKTLQLSQFYGLTVIGDDHDYTCPSTTFWQPVFQDTPQSAYPNVIWEPMNEPHCSTLSSADQGVVNLARSAGDTRWFVLGCNNDCSPDGSTTDFSAFPSVTDTAGHVAYDFHEYYFYRYHRQSWSTSDAINWADQKYAGVLNVLAHVGPFIGTEWGADTGCTKGHRTCPPDQTVTGSAGYSPETLAYISEIVKKMQGAGIGYTLWNAGDWNDPPAGPTGALDTYGACPPLNGAALPCMPRP